MGYLAPMREIKRQALYM